jgi:drug/metabolite transporter (DMT)-like permease
MRFSFGLSSGAGALALAFVIVVWGVTFASTRALLEDFSSFEILALRFSLAWAALWSSERLRGIAKVGNW